MKHILNEDVIPNFANMINIKINDSLFQKIINKVEPRADNKYIEIKAFLGPTR